jgi:hypothetical protein
MPVPDQMCNGSLGMASTRLWAADTADPWAAVQQGLKDAWQGKASERLQELNR